MTEINGKVILLCNHPRLTAIKEAHEAVLDAVDADTPLAELQPLIYLHLKETWNEDESGEYNRQVTVGSTERTHELLYKSGIHTMLDLVEQSQSHFREKVKGVGPKVSENILAALCIYHRHDEAVETMNTDMMPNPRPAKKLQSKSCNDQGYSIF